MTKNSHPSRAGVCAAIKVSKLPDLNARADLTWEIYDLYVWTM